MTCDSELVLVPCPDPFTSQHTRQFLRAAGKLAHLTHSYPLLWRTALGQEGATLTRRLREHVHIHVAFTASGQKLCVAEAQRANPPDLKAMLTQWGDVLLQSSPRDQAEAKFLLSTPFPVLCPCPVSP